MSSHKEAPGLLSDPAADNSDVYAFVSPDKPDTVTLIANFVPVQDPAGGPNFYEFGDDVLYEIHIDNDGDAVADITYQFRFRTEYTTPASFLYNTGPITSLDSPKWNRKQFGTMVKLVGGVAVAPVDGVEFPCPPCNVGPASTPNYAALADAAIKDLGGGRSVFAGQRAEGFYVDLGAIFDLGNLRPLQNLHVASQMPAAPGVNGLKVKNVHSIVLQVPKTDLTADGVAANDPTLATSTIGVYATASRQSSRVIVGDGTYQAAGGWVQISRLANPLFNEVLVPVDDKNGFNASDPSDDATYADNVNHPELAKLLPVLYPDAFPNLAGLVAAGTARADLDAVLLTGIPAGLIPGFQNYTGAVKADLLRLNMAIPPTTTDPSNLGLVGGDAAGFPNGRRVFDDVTTIELRAIAGAVYPLVDKTYTPDAAVGAITQGLTSSNTDVTAKNTVHYLPVFPYLGTPHSGFYNPNDNTPAPDLGAQPAPVVAPPVVAPPGQVTQIPVGAPETGGGSMAGLGSGTGRTLAGGAAVVGAAVLARTMAGRDDDAVAASGVDSAGEQ